MVKKGLGPALLLAGFMASSAAYADDLVYTPINPSFGGNPLNSSHLLSLANAQRDATAGDVDNGTGGTGGTGGGDTSESDIDLFIRQLQGRLLSALASQVTEAIFGDNPQDNGTITFGDTTVQFDRTADAITLTITDGEGTVTVITVPQLVTADPGSAFAASSLAASQTAGRSSLASSLSGSGSLSGGSLGGALTPIN
jgi:curli production assembly/transport component CsgF